MPEIVIFNGLITTVAQITFLSNHFHHGQFDTQSNRYHLIKNLLTLRNLTHHRRMLLLRKYRITECFLCESLQTCTVLHVRDSRMQTKQRHSPVPVTSHQMSHYISHQPVGIMCDRKIKWQT